VKGDQIDEQYSSIGLTYVIKAFIKTLESFEQKLRSLIKRARLSAQGASSGRIVKIKGFKRFESRMFQKR
jgi:hypothetical protein